LNHQEQVGGLGTPGLPQGFGRSATWLGVERSGYFPGGAGSTVAAPAGLRPERPSPPISRDANHEPLTTAPTANRPPPDRLPTANRPGVGAAQPPEAPPAAPRQARRPEAAAAKDGADRARRAERQAARVVRRCPFSCFSGSEALRSVGEGGAGAALLRFRRKRGAWFARRACRAEGGWVVWPGACRRGRAP
jgi:hypothetical protein